MIKRRSDFCVMPSDGGSGSGVIINNDTAPAIVNAASDENITLSDSADAPLRDMHIYGHTTQNTTTGSQLFNIDGDVNWVKTSDSVPRSENTVINGILISNNNSAKTAGSGQKIDVIPKAIYTFSVNVISFGTGTGALIAINGETINLAIQNITALGTTSLTYLTKESETELIFSFATRGGTGAQFTDIMVNAGSTPLPWEPYTGGQPSPSPEYPQAISSAGDGGNIDVTVTGKNLFDAACAKNLDNWMPSAQNGYVDFPVRIGAGNDFTLSYDATLQMGLGFYAGITLHNDAYMHKWLYHSTTVTLITNIISDTAVEDYIYIRCSRSGVQTMLDALKNLQIEYGTTPSAYEPYKRQKVSLSTPTGLPGIPVDSGGNYTDENGQQWVCDEIDLGRGKYVQMVGQIESYDGEDVTSQYMSTTGELSVGATIYYILSTPIETDLTAEQIAAYKTLHTNYPTTVVTNDADAWMDVSYAADTKNYIDNKIAALERALVNG